MGFLAGDLVAIPVVHEVGCRGVVVVVRGPGVGQVAAGVLAAVQQLHQGVARAHARKAGVKRSLDVVLLFMSTHKTRQIRTRGRFAAASDLSGLEGL